jgi:hypothetical protein
MKIYVRSRSSASSGPAPRRDGPPRLPQIDVIMPIAQNVEKRPTTIETTQKKNRLYHAGEFRHEWVCCCSCINDSTVAVLGQVSDCMIGMGCRSRSPTEATLRGSCLAA